MQVRKAAQDDYQPVLELLNGLVGENRYSNRDKDSFNEVLGLGQHGVFVAEEDSVIVGIASVSIRRVIRYAKPIAELDELFVDQNVRSRGAGTALMEAVEAFARDNKCYRLYIESGYQHDTGHKFYENRGYKNYGYHFLKNL